jgi:ribosomal protein S18 acetylase RimI-like enzyme
MPREPSADRAPGGVEIRRIRPSELAAVHELLSSNGWRERLGGVERFASLIEASQVADVAVVDGRVVGFVRAITDGQSNGYLSMLAVAADRRRRGLGRALVLHAMGSNVQVTWVLRAGREGAAGFFSRLGFEPSSLAMERRRA